MNPTVKQFAIRFGLIAGGIHVAYTLIAYIVNEELYSHWWAGASTMLAVFIVKIVGVFQARSAMGGYIEFKEAFTTYFVSSIIAIALFFAINTLIFQVLDTELSERVIDKTIENTIGMMERMGADQSGIDEAISSMESQEQYSFKNQAMTAMWFILIQAVFGLVIAALTKRSKPVIFESSTEENTEV